MLDLFFSAAETIKELQELEKQAEEEQRRGLLERITHPRRKKYHYLFGKRISEQHAQNIQSTLAKKQPRTKEERQIQSIVGARPTPGQMGRHVLIGAGGGLATHLIGSAIEGGNKWIPDMSEGVVKGLLRQRQKTVLHPRSLARAAAVGSMVAGAIPAAKRIWDIQTARERPEAF